MALQEGQFKHIKALFFQESEPPVDDEQVASTIPIDSELSGAIGEANQTQHLASPPSLNKEMIQNEEAIDADVTNLKIAVPTPPIFPEVTDANRVNSEIAVPTPSTKPEHIPQHQNQITLVDDFKMQLEIKPLKLPGEKIHSRQSLAILSGIVVVCIVMLILLLLQYFLEFDIFDIFRAEPPF